MRGGFPVTERFDERGDVPAVVGRQLVDAGDQEVPFPVAGALLPGRSLVVVVQPGGFRGGGADHRDRDIEAFGERVNGGRARRPDQVPRDGEGVHSGPGQAAAARHRAVGPAPVTQPILDQPLQRVHVLLRRRHGISRPVAGELRLIVRRVRRHGYQFNPCFGHRGSS